MKYLDHTNYETFVNCNSNNQLPGLKTSPLNDQLAAQYQIYPSPSDGNLTVTLSDSWKSGNIAIYNLQGQLMWSLTQVTMKKVDIDFNIPNGTYLIKISPDEQAPTVQKIVIIH